MSYKTETLKIGVIGTGAIGEDHIRRCMQSLSGAEIVAVTDVNLVRAREVADKYASQAKVPEDGESLIALPEVEAVIVTSWGGTHAQYVLEAIRHGKYVFCEKPLATTAADCLKIVEAEAAHGKRLVQVGFMRPYDSGYRALKALIDKGEIGEVLMIHAAHRNQRVGANYKTDMGITDTLVHELDVFRWMLGDDYVSAQVIFPRRTSKAMEHMRDPQIVLLETKKGIRIDVEIFVNCQYGYDIKCAVVGELGEASLPAPPAVELRKAASLSTEIMTDWKERFIAAYDVEVQDFINGVKAGKLNGATSWDGYCASVAADACVKAQESGRIEPITMSPRPGLYGG
ncbi:Gfo/Idh/MocA family protein [Asaia bogorensis]|uniref:Inositol 2-dehydrogenase n=1 Tax=Asaia bogorensis NBRC 16594 TaxID=1231624 RepID=A0AAN4R2C4_9PROT|nr:Gfo/Idh/MocA family oxidoreductase [Asaia bogorensis]BAT18649.1 inositol 2-dehydrogenase [Asaia bogorensis NBRC 16594]GBQ75436.1 putative dehydrogenase [Asaia bogorensis NBRC 16594]GEL53003.1 inositol 2-dehydrogenase [Asaia bogorensis NBRC 16594]